MWKVIIGAGLLAAGCCAAQAMGPLAPIRLHAGVNRIPDIAGDGAPGTVRLQWRENGNAWGYDIFTVSVRGSVATIEGKDQIADQPHTGEDMVRSVRFARGTYGKSRTLFLLVANRNIVDSVPDPAVTTIRIYALARNSDGLGTPYEFRRVSNLTAKRRYCNADMALRTELGLPLTQSYSGPLTLDGCPT